MTAQTTPSGATAEQTIQGYCGNCKKAFRIRIREVWTLLNEQKLSIRCPRCRAVFRYSLNIEADLIDVVP